MTNTTNQPNKEKIMQVAKTVTRQQLQGYGATRYHAITLTKNLTPVLRKSRTYVYSLSDVVEVIRDYLQRSRIKPKTCQTLNIILQVLLERLGNVIEIPFSCGTNSEINALAKSLSQAMSNTDVALAELKATAAEINAKYNN
jgi:hypothetical protein